MMDRKCEVKGCDNLVECAHAPDLRASICADHLSSETLRRLEGPDEPLDFEKTTASLKKVVDELKEEDELKEATLEFLEGLVEERETRDTV